ncbi:hypothetical protein [Lentzea sp. NBRC 102530]|uniref:hypothetical protein n=1 Tax=Lentzea sp. NBRC 102530 TaxID=3032201 RepID=UPI0024A58073|nr:hypothetical protein [Lentzea sp. NBRC 102530]GLY55368.1 hypothetical protein Lesp01_90230 [Lentzea sp. NBRC 102530]
MRTLINAITYGSEHVKAVDLAAGLGLAALATADVPGFLSWCAGIGAVFLLGRELLHHYAFTKAWMRAAEYSEQQLQVNVDNWSDDEKKRNLPPLTEQDVDEAVRRLNGDEAAGS